MIGQRKRLLGYVRTISEKRYTELIEKLAKIKSRCLIISGSQDRLSTKEMNMELHNKIKNSEIYFVTKSGHFVMLEEFEKFNKKILSWLN